jgi:hypothetical protein
LTRQEENYVIDLLKIKEFKLQEFNDINNYIKIDNINKDKDKERDFEKRKINTNRK